MMVRMRYLPCRILLPVWGLTIDQIFRVCGTSSETCDCFSACEEGYASSTAKESDMYGYT